MHNVTIIGDMRIHELIPPSEAHQNEPLQMEFLIYGGAALAGLTIERTFEGQAEGESITVPTIYRYLTPCLNAGFDTSNSKYCEEDQADFEWIEQLLKLQRSDLRATRRWRLKPTSIDGVEGKQLRLRNPQGRAHTNASPPPPLHDKPVLIGALPRELIESLSDPARPLHREKCASDQREDPGPNETFRMYPDVVVIDDLDIRKYNGESDGVRVARLGLNVLDTANRQTIHKDAAEFLKNVISEDSSNKVSFDGEFARQVQVSVMQCLFSRLLDAFEPGRRMAYPPMEPVIICSVAGQRLPVLPPRHPKDSKDSTYWDALYGSPQLRRRTVVIFDADDLRRSETGEAGISFEISWERTVDDTIDAFNRLNHLRYFLSFGHVIVRYGVTGALILSREHTGELRSVLYFDPERHDQTWQHSEREGQVLGTSSILISQIVKALDGVCKERIGKPHLHDLSDSIHEGVRKAIPKMQELMANGYGPENGPEGSRDGGLMTLAKVKDRFRGLPPETDFEGRSMSAFPEGINRDVIHHASRAVVPSATISNWSILRQSVRYDVLDVAERVVRRGVDSVFNPHRILKHEISEDLASQMLEIVNKKELLPFFQAIKQSPETFRDYVKEEIVKKVFPQLPFTDSCDGNMPLWEQMGEPLSRWVLSKMTESDQIELAKILSDKIIEVYEAAESPLREFYSDQNSMPQNQFSRILKTAVPELRRLLAAALNDPVDFDESLGETVAPIRRIGKKSRQMVVMDRWEIEGFSAIGALMHRYVEQVRDADQEQVQKEENRHRRVTAEQRPMSIGIFGPPGSGKSFAVKRMAEEIEGGGVSFKQLNFNLSQFTSSDQLEPAFQAIVAARADRKLPLVFFDEFDCKLDDEDFGWLKYFLAPMEDGLFREKNVSTAIFVFAGGTSSTFADFSLAQRQKTDDAYVKFSKAKGPDFVSRLAGHLNVFGMDPLDDNDGLYPLRRALFIRSLLEHSQSLSSRDEARIDPALVRALIRTPVYRHGGRSIRMLLDACSDRTGAVTRSSIPVIDQLNMIVDAKSFVENLHSP